MYTFEEVKLLNQIALCYSDLEQHPQALSIYCQLIEYIQRHYPEVILKNGQLHMILCNYARELNITQQYQQSILIAEKGRTACVPVFTLSISARFSGPDGRVLPLLRAG